MTLDKNHLEYSNRRLESALKYNDAHLIRLESHMVSSPSLLEQAAHVMLHTPLTALLSSSRLPQAPGCAFQKAPRNVHAKFSPSSVALQLAKLGDCRRKSMAVQGVREIEQQMCLESLARFVNSIDGLGTDQEALKVIKQWPLRNLEAFHLVSTPPSIKTASWSRAMICHNMLVASASAEGF